ncbi:MAG: YgfZ/GcvT domain-containing protein [Rubripirellula sp.]
MKTPTIDRLDRISIVEVVGSDAATIVNNVTTNEVTSLELGEGRESFVTDVRGKTLGHVCLFREESVLRMIGAPGQSDAIHAHIDRYTIREDATPEVMDEGYVAFVLSPDAAEIADLRLTDGVVLKSCTVTVGGVAATGYGTRWLGEGTVVVVCGKGDATAVSEGLLERLKATGSAQLELGNESTFHQRRTREGFPWLGIDLDESNLPQEADRDDVAISFTKGCYLGQETVARLDALGQVQKKLVRWSISGGVPMAGTTLESDGKKVARLTSVTEVTNVTEGESDSVLAIGFARRSHFDAGSTASGTIDSELGDGEGNSIVGTVL